MNQLKTNHLFSILVLACLLGFCSITHAQSKRSTIIGQVSDENGKALAHVNVSAQGAKNRLLYKAKSDSLGQFTLQSLAADDIYDLYFSMLGYESKTIKGYRLKADNQNNVLITMASTSQLLEDVVVVGYGTQKKSNLTGAVSQIDMKKVLANRPVNNLGAALQGAMPGLTASSSTTPGGGNTFNIRGTTSINGGAPLILVDNVVQNNLYLINPEDIESVTILKDASSAAIYGARASFGVILITTKKGKKNQAISLNYSDNLAFSNVNNLPRKASPLETVNGLKDMGYTAYWSGQNIDTWLNLLAEYQSDPSKYPLGWTDVNGTKYFLRETDLIGDMMDKFGFKQTHNISVHGGAEKIAYRLSLAQMNENGILITDKDAFKRTNISSFVEGQITDWLSTSLDARVSVGDRAYPNAGWHNQYWNTNLPSYHPDDVLPLNGVDYPVQTPQHALENASKQTWKANDVRLSSKTVITPFEGMKVNFEYTYQHSDDNNKKYNNYFVLHQGLQDALNPSDQNTEYYVQKTLTDYKSLNLYANYDRSIANDHHIAAVLGYNQELSVYEGQWSRAFEMISNELPFLGGTSGNTPVETGDSFDEFALRGAFGRLSYNYKQRYFAEMNGRYDLSSKFPSDFRGGFFPSFSFGWNLAEESFMNDIKQILSMFKLRGSYGKLGNQTVSNYGFLPTMGPYDATWIYRSKIPKTLRMPGMVRANYTWENVETFNGGIDIGLFRDKLTVTFEKFRRNTLGMLAPGMDFPAVAGASAPYQNAADLKTLGWELSANWNDRRGGVLYGAGINVFDSKTYITKYRNESKLLGAYYEGMQIGEIWGYETDGFYKADDFEANGALKSDVVSINGVISHEGDIKYKNLRDSETSLNRIDNGDNTLDNPGDRKVIGNNAPRYSFGLNGFVEWKGINLSFILQGVGKRDAWIGGEIQFPHSNAFSTFFAHQLDYWRPDNTDAYYGRIYQNAQEAHGVNQRVQTKFLSNAAYLRVKNISLSYNLPVNLLQKVKLKSASVFYSGENLFTFSEMLPGVDPESLQWTYPHYITNSIGLRIQL